MNSFHASERASELRVWCFSNTVSSLLLYASRLLMIRMTSTVATWLPACSTNRPARPLQYTLSLQQGRNSARQCRAGGE